MTDPASRPDPNMIFPIPNLNTLTLIKPTLTRPNIIAGDFSYYAGQDFESHVTHHYDFIGDKLIIGKFCQIGAGVEFVMNGANHQMNCATTYPFYIFGGWNENPPAMSDLPLKGDTVVGNDVWIGQNVTVLPGVRIGDGVIVGLNSTVTRGIPPYVVAAGNPARVIRERFDRELTGLLLALRWWDRSIDEIRGLVPVLTCPDLERVKRELRALMDRNLAKQEAMNAEMNARIDAMNARQETLYTEIRGEIKNIHTRIDGVIDTFSVAINDLKDRIDDIKTGQTNGFARWGIAIAVFVGIMQVAVAWFMK